jgi:ribonucleoside-diphosphate reductase alpha chain
VTSNFEDNQSGVTVANCGETDLLPYEGCCLGSLNLTKFFSEDKICWDALSKAIYNAVHFLDDVIDATDYILPKIKEISHANRKIGLGIMGFADLLYMMKIPYDSDKAVETADKLMEFVYLETKKSSEQLAQERGSFPNIGVSIYTKPIRNASFTVIAPTGEISILANCSGGIEPNFGLVFKRQTTLAVKELITINPVFEAVAKREGFYSSELLDKIIKNNGSARGIKEIPEEWQKIFVIAYEVSPEYHIKIQAAFQHHCDNSVSKTINLPNNATISDVEKCIKLAYDLGCNGLTVFRDGCRDTQVMSTGENTCPECKVELVFAEGCYHCPSCGWGKCNI